MTAILTIDDLFMRHESLLKVYCGLEEIHSYLAYIVFFLAGGVVFRKQILRTDYWLLIAVFGFWGISLVIDVTQHEIEHFIKGSYRILLEDGAKFLGLVTWAGYFFRVCYQRLLESTVRGESP